jgi:exosortase
MTFKKNQVIFIGLCSLSLLAGWRPLFDTLALSFQNDEYTQILLVLPISAALIFLERPWLRSTGMWDLRLAPALLAIAFAIAGVSSFSSAGMSGDIKLSVQMIALVLSWIGIFVLCFGAAVARSVLFPLLFLFGLIPVPQAGLNVIVAWLQLGSAWSAHALFAMFGVPAFQEGTFLTIPGLTIQVAQECSSIRSSSMLLVTTIVLAQILLRSSWRKVFVVCLAIPLSVAKNGLRIFTIAMLGTRVDPGYLTGRLHHQGGILFFAIALLGIFFALAVCQRQESASLQASSTDKLRFHNVLRGVPRA